MQGVKSYSRQTTRLFWNHTKRYGILALATVAAIALANVVEVVIPWLYKDFFDVLSGEKTVDAGALAPTLIHTLWFILFLHLVSWLLWRVSMWMNSYFQPSVMADLSFSSFRYILRHSYRFFSNSFAGTLVRRINRLSRSFEDVADQLQFNVIQLFVTIVGIIIAMFYRNAVVGLVLLIWTVVYIIGNVLFARWKQRYDLAKADKDSEATGILADAITNSANIKLFSGYEHEEKRYRKVLDEWRRMTTFSWRLSEISDASQALLMTFIEFLIMYVAVRLWLQGIFTIGDFALIQGYLIALFIRLWNFGRIVRKFYEAYADANEVVEILETPHEVIDVRSAKTLRVKQGRIQFENVHFAYRQTRKLLRGLDLTIEPGEKVAFVGPSGAGKSTLTKLLFRFFDLDQGRIRIDGKDIAKYTQESVCDNIALVPQEPVLFHRTILENIRYGRRNASNEAVAEAARKARCDVFIKDLPHGYDTYVGERGVKLSGGERQRVAIARAILKDAPILVLDEATSSLDSESEALIQEALDELMKGKTTIAIAHRLSTIMKMDRIIVIDQGRVVDTGTHETLKRKRGIYKKLWDIQAGGFL